VLMPDAIPAERVAGYGARPPKLVTYPGLKEEYYLANFRPDAAVPAALGLDGERIGLVLRPPADLALYHRFENPLFDALLEQLGRSDQVRGVVLAHAGSGRAIRAMALPRCWCRSRRWTARACGGRRPRDQRRGTMNREEVVLARRSTRPSREGWAGSTSGYCGGPAAPAGAAEDLYWSASPRQHTTASARPRPADRPGGAGFRPGPTCSRPCCLTTRAATWAAARARPFFAYGSATPAHATGVATARLPGCGRGVGRQPTGRQPAVRALERESASRCSTAAAEARLAERA
jgi:hypothetical protein